MKWNLQGGMYCSRSILASVVGWMVCPPDQKEACPLVCQQGWSAWSGGRASYCDHLQAGARQFHGNVQAGQGEWQRCGSYRVTCHWPHGQIVPKINEARSLMKRRTVGVTRWGAAGSGGEARIRRKFAYFASFRSIII